MWANRPASLAVADATCACDAATKYADGHVDDDEGFVPSGSGKRRTEVPRQLEDGRRQVDIARGEDPVSASSAVDAEQKNLGVWQFISREVPILRKAANCHSPVRRAASERGITR
jgi:hypothetical protein